MWHNVRVEIQRTITILLPDDVDIHATLDAFQQVSRALSEPCFNGGKPLGALALQRACYHTVKGTLNAQMTISATRAVAAAYAAAKSNGRPATRPFEFRRKRAVFLIGQCSRDADFRADGTLSIWTVAGRKRIGYTVPEAFRTWFESAKEFDALNVIERNGQLLGRLTLTLDVPEPQGIHPVGIDLNETNVLVAVDADGRTLFVSGRAIKVANTRTRKTRARLSRRLSSRKAERQDTHGVRRTLKRLGRKQRNRTRTFAQTTAKRLVTWAPENAVLVFEDLNIPQPEKGTIRGKVLRRRLSLWQRRLMRECVEHKAEERGMAVDEVDPAYTSKNCSRCGLRGIRKRHVFRCPHCGHEAHADVNAAINIRHRYTVARLGSGAPVSVGAEALVLR